jgi:hypothetical protein
MLYALLTQKYVWRRDVAKELSRRKAFADDARSPLRQRRR